MTPVTGRQAGGADQPAHPDAPPVGEEIHLPGPSAIPMLNAFGVALALSGLALGFPITLAGLLLFAWSLQRWVRDTRADIGDLPDSHG